MGDVRPQIASCLAASAAGLNVFIAGSSTFGEDTIGAHATVKHTVALASSFSVSCQLCMPAEATSTGRKLSHNWVEQFVVSREGKISKLEFFYDADQYSDAFQTDLGSEADGEAVSGRSEKSLS